MLALLKFINGLVLAFLNSIDGPVLALLNPYWSSRISINSPEMHRRGILMYPVYYVRKTLKKNIFEIK